MKNWKNYLGLSLKVLIIFVVLRGIVWACGPGPGYWEMEHPVYFSPHIPDTSKEFELYYFTPYQFNTPHDEYGVSSEPAASESGSDFNVDTWYVRLNQKVSKRDIDDFLYSSPDFVFTSSTSIKEFIRQYSSYEMIRFLDQKGKKKELNYLYVAKRNEYGYNRLESGWESFNQYDHYGTETISNAQRKDFLLPVIISQLAKEKDIFWQRRYAFQLIRNYRYNMHNKEADSIFTKYFASGIRDFLYYEALNYACDALVNAGYTAKANCYASMLFSDYAPKRLRAYQNLTRSNPIESSLSMVLTNKEKSDLFTLYAFRDYYPNAIYIKEAVKLDEHNKMTDLLIIREINKLDHKLLPGSNRNYDNTDDDTDENAGQTIYNEDGQELYTYPDIKANSEVLITLLKELTALNNSKRDFYKICMAHVYLQMHRYIESQRLLNEVRPATLDNYLAAQFYLTSTILFVKSRDIKDQTTRDLLSNKLTVLDRFYPYLYNTSYIKDGLSLLMMEKLVETKDFARAYLLSASLPEQYDDYDILDRYARPKDIDTIIAYISSPKTSYDKHLVAIFRRRGNEDNLRQIQGSLYMREHDVVNAHLCFKRKNQPYIPINFKKLNTNPDGHQMNPFYYDTLTEEEKQYRTQEEIAEWNNRADEYAIRYNEYSITKEMLTLMLAIGKKQGNIAQHYFNLACLQFEVTYYGRAFRAVNYHGTWGWNEVDYLEYQKSLPLYYEDYYGCKKAIDYYTKALELSTNKELSAKCLYALFRCNRHMQKFRRKEGDESELGYLYRLHDHYRETDYYKIKECWGLTAYVKELRADNKRR